MKQGDIRVSKHTRNFTDTNWRRDAAQLKQRYLDDRYANMFQHICAQVNRLSVHDNGKHQQIAIDFFNATTPGPSQQQSTERQLKVGGFNDKTISPFVSS